MFRTKRKLKAIRIALILVQIGFATAPCLANGQIETQKSRIVGVVLDRNEARIVGAVITIKNANFTRRVRSDEEGRFELELPAGAYEIMAEQRGFKTFKRSSLRADAGATAQIDIHMEVAPPRQPLKINPARNLQ